MTTQQMRTLVAVFRHWHAHGDQSWYRAPSSGSRVTLASLYRQGLLSRRPWRGQDGDADAAYEYRPTDDAYGAWIDWNRKSKQSRSP